MTTLYHPNMRNTTVDVAEGDVKAWTDAGWQKTEPKRFKAPADESKTTTTTRSSASGEDKNKEG